MKNKMWMMIPILCALLLALAGSTGAQGPAPQGDVGAQAALGTAFTYQGRLTDNDAPAGGTYDFEFKLYDALSDGAQVGSTVTQEGAAVTEGVFTVQLDFGASAFNGDARYLEVGVRTGGSADPYTTLSPRQPLTAVPYALYALQSPADAEVDALERRILALESWQGYGNAKFVFLTQNRYSGNLGGLAGGDAFCQSEADAAGLPGTYKAWLSTASASPNTRFTQATVPYILPNGTWVARDWADLTDGSLLAPIDRGPDGEPIDCTGWDCWVWTGTKADGTPDTYTPIRDCTGWTDALTWYGVLGDTAATGSQWSINDSLFCANLLHLYCFQQ
jgi:hypothetical protein